MNGKTALGLDKNVGSLLCYLPVCLISLIYSIIVIVSDKENKDVRFHAFQSILLTVLYIVVIVLVQIIGAVAAGAEAGGYDSIVDAAKQMAKVREETFIEASRSIGTPMARIVRTRILPNVLPPLLVQISLAAGFALLAEASLSFLGLGVELPDSSWGQMLGRGYNNFSRQPWLIVWPGVTIALTVLAYNVMGDGLRDSLGREERREK